MQIPVSVIIPTYNGAKKIDRLLASLLEQSIRTFEVIVVIDGSTDSTEETLQKYRDRFNEFAVIKQENKGRAGARNAGAKIARHDLLIFYDDDMEVSTDSVQRHSEFHFQHDHVCLVTGHQEEPPAESDVEEYRKYLTNFWFSKFPTNVTRLDFGNLFFAAANSSILKKTFERLTGFDERLSDAEDYDLAFRALQQNIHVYFDKNNRTLHHDRNTCKSYIKRQRQYQKAKLKWNEIHHQPVRSEPGLIRKILYWPFAFRPWVRAIDQEYFTIFPKKMRYKLYSIVVHSLSVVFPNIDLD